MLTLYHNDMSTCAQKVRLALAEKQLDWQSEHLKLREGDQFKPEYLALNPKGVVPTLLHDDVVVTESQVVLEYLDDAFPGISLRSDKAAERARMRLWTKQLDEDVHAATGVISMCIAFRHQFLVKGEAAVKAYLDKVVDPVRKERMTTLMQAGTSAPAFAAAVKRFDRLFQDMEASLIKNTWLAGESYSLADISYTPYLLRIEHLHMIGMLEDYPKLKIWYDAVKVRENFDTAVTKWLNPGYIEVFDSKAPAEWSKVASILGKNN